MTRPLDLSAASDQDLVSHALAGHMEAYDELVHRHRSVVYDLLYRLLRDPDLADDLTQEVFVKAFHQLESHRPEKSFSSWILKIANNRGVDVLRRARREPDTVPLEPTPDTSNRRGFTAAARRPVGWSTPTPPPRDTSALAPALDEALGRLKEPHRQCFVLREIEGRSYDDIAELLDLPTGTVGPYLTQARRELRAMLGPLHEALRASSPTPA